MSQDLSPELQRLWLAMQRARPAMSWADLARHLNVRPQVIGNWVQRGRISSERLLDVAEIVGVPPLFLRSGEGRVPDVSNPPESGSMAFAQIYNDMPDLLKAQMRMFLEMQLDLVQWFLAAGTIKSNDLARYRTLERSLRAFLDAERLGVESPVGPRP